MRFCSKSFGADSRCSMNFTSWIFYWLKFPGKKKRSFSRGIEQIHGWMRWQARWTTGRIPRSVARTDRRMAARRWKKETPEDEGVCCLRRGKWWNECVLWSSQSVITAAPLHLSPIRGSKTHRGWRQEVQWTEQNQLPSAVGRRLTWMCNFFFLFLCKVQVPLISPCICPIIP